LPAFPDYKVGCTAYENFFSHEELMEIEQQIWETEIKAFNGNLNNILLPIIRCFPTSNSLD